MGRFYGKGGRVSEEEEVEEEGVLKAIVDGKGRGLIGEDTIILTGNIAVVTTVQITEGRTEGSGRMVRGWRTETVR